MRQGGFFIISKFSIHCHLKDDSSRIFFNIFGNGGDEAGDENNIMKLNSVSSHHKGGVIVYMGSQTSEIPLKNVET